MDSMEGKELMPSWAAALLMFIALIPFWGFIYTVWRDTNVSAEETKK